ncbi:Uncharacterised protein [Providencia rustigianii]|nr:Uncharacterised protein [Providencia rustigianii]
MSQRLSGQSFDFNIDGDLIHVEKVSYLLRIIPPRHKPEACPMGMLLVM